MAVAILALQCAGAPTPTPNPFILFASIPLVGHTTPLVYEAAALARMNVAGRIVVANTAFVGGPQEELTRMFEHPEGEAYGLGLEFVQVGFVNLDARHLVNFDVAIHGGVRVHRGAETIC